MKNAFWNFELRSLIYKTLLTRFGRHESWVGTTSPGDRKKLNETFEELSGVISLLANREVTSGAIEQQFRWAVTKQKFKTREHYQLHILNLVPALETGFVKNSEIQMVQ